MEIEPESSPRDYDESKYPQCPNCGRYNPKRRKRYVVPQTGSRVRKKEVGCQETFVVFVAAFLVTGIVTLIILNIAGIGSDPLAGDAVGFIGIFFGFLGATIALPVYVLIQSRPTKTNMTVTHCVCKYCKKEWDVVQESPAKK